MKDRLGSLLAWVLGALVAGALYLLLPDARTAMSAVSGFALALLAAVAVLAAVHRRRRQDT